MVADWTSTMFTNHLLSAGHPLQDSPYGKTLPGTSLNMANLDIKDIPMTILSGCFVIEN